MALLDLLKGQTGASLQKDKHVCTIALHTNNMSLVVLLS